VEPVGPDDARPARTLVVRVWLPDRPGALGLVASRIGAVHGDVLAIDILERGGGQAIDELLVSLPVGTPEDLLVNEIGAVDGVAVESVRPAPADRSDSATALFALAADVAERCGGDPAASLVVLGDGLAVALDADWVVIQGREGERYRHGVPPAPRWLEAFLHGSGHLGGDEYHGPADVMWARLPAAGLVIAAGRATRAAHERERSRLHLLARIVDRLLAEGARNAMP
jgi:hypothetical protein